MPQECNHSNVYLGVVNIRYQNQTIGAVDVWRCTKCLKMAAEEKQLAVVDLSPEIGMPSLGPGERWAVLVCGLKQFKERWALVKVKKDDKLKHRCAEREAELDISDYGIRGDDKHRLLMVDQSVNKEVEID